MNSRSSYIRVVLLAAPVAAMISCGKDDGSGLATNPSPSASPAMHPQDATWDAIDTIIQPLIDDQWARAVVVGAVTKDGSAIRSYGQLSADNPSEPDAETVFEIGSLTKVFTALLLADMVERGEVSLEAPIRDFLPPNVQTPKRGKADIRLLDLATHTSGLPNIAANFWQDGDNVYAPDVAGRRWSGYTEEQLFESLHRHFPAPNGQIGFVYSNLGMGLLGHLLELKSGQTYEHLLVERICEPLKMRDTRLALTDDMRARRAQGHNADGMPSRLGMAKTRRWLAPSPSAQRHMT